MAWLDEQKTLLGAQLGGFAGAGGSQTVFADTGATLDLGKGWSITGAYRQGWTRMAAGGLRLGTDRLVSNAWSFDVSGKNALMRGDRLAFRIAQPLRVVSGGLNLNLPDSYDYASLTATTANRFLSLAPTGREVAREVSWSVPMAGGNLGTNIYWRTEPGHRLASGDDLGVAIRFALGL